jgi:uncharacterized protein (TIGR03437 family)
MRQLAPVLVLVLAFPLGAQEIRTVQVTTGIVAPTDIQNAGDGTGRLFFVQQNGVIRVMREGALLAEPFLDIRAKTRGTGERGLLGLAFPPGFAQSQRFYVNYTDLAGNTVIAMYRVTSNPDVADAASETVLLNITQPFSNHNGGQLRFGPDGYLYIGMGDGGSGGDPQNNGQRMDALLGKMLRLDVESEPGRMRIPPDNPFVNTAGARPEIWALGLRNPWRYAFDRVTGDLWIADVGQNLYEEVNFQPGYSRGGENYGWNLMEGMHCFRANCNQQGLTLPVAEYGRADGCSVTGASVYRGTLYPSLRGVYVYGDYCSGRIWGLQRQGASWSARLLLDTDFSITTFGEDEAGEIYVAFGPNGSIYRIEGSRAPHSVNAASFEAGLVPGSLATVFTSGFLTQPGVTQAERIPLPVSLGGVTVSVNGTPAPLLAVASVNGIEQVNFQVPFNVATGSASVTLTRGGQSVTAPATSVASQPAIFTSDGGRAVAVHNADYTLIAAGSPLAPGEYAFLYATGLGDVTNPPPTGSGALASPLSVARATVEVLIGERSCPVQFAGLAPGLVGVFQINFQAPAGIPGGLQPLRLRVDGVPGREALIPVR